MVFSSSWGSWRRISPAPSAWKASASRSRSQSRPGWSSSAKAHAFGLCARRGPVCHQATCWCPGSAGASPHTTSACIFRRTCPQIHLERKTQQQVDTGPNVKDTNASNTKLCSYIPMSSSASREAEGTRGVGPGWGGTAGRLFLTPSFLLWSTNDQISSS